MRDKVRYVIQVNGKVRGRVGVAEGTEREAVKVVLVPGRLVNFVVK